MLRVLSGLFLVILLAAASPAAAQQPQLATLSEQIQIVVEDGSPVRSSVSLLSTNSQEIMFPQDVAEAVIRDGRISDVVVTSGEDCALGVTGQFCVLINMFPADVAGDVVEVSRDVADIHIDSINEAFGIDAKFHSVLLQTDASSGVLGTTGSVSGKQTALAIYTMPDLPADLAFQRASEMLSDAIRVSGGFYDIASEMSLRDGAGVTVLMSVLDDRALYQVRVSAESPADEQMRTITPLAYLGVDEIRRSDYYSGGFYPLNSLLSVIVVSAEPVRVTGSESDILETTVEGGDIPVDITKSGWVLDPAADHIIDAKFLFGTEVVLKGNILDFELGPEIPDGEQDGPGSGLSESDNDNTLAILFAIVAAAIVAAYYYTRGYKKGP